jgi:hypothetical protein
VRSSGGNAPWCYRVASPRFLQSLPLSWSSARRGSSPSCSHSTQMSRPEPNWRSGRSGELQEKRPQRPVSRSLNVHFKSRRDSTGRRQGCAPFPGLLKMHVGVPFTCSGPRYRPRKDRYRIFRPRRADEGYFLSLRHWAKCTIFMVAAVLKPAMRPNGGGHVLCMYRLGPTSTCQRYAWVGFRPLDLQQLPLGSRNSLQEPDGH